MVKKYVTVKPFVDLQGSNILTKDKEYEVLGIMDKDILVISDTGYQLWIHNSVFTSTPYTEEEEKQTIFTHPKWVTIKDDSLGSVTKDKDYKVLNYWRDNYKILDDNGLECSLNKERFYKVTPEDLLPPKKKSVEHIDEGFDDLVYVAPEEDGVGILYDTLTKSQRNFILCYLDFNKRWGFNEPDSYYIEYDLEGKQWFTEETHYPDKVISFNDIFKHALRTS